MLYLVWISNVGHIYLIVLFPLNGTLTRTRGNLAQLGLAIARIFAPEQYTTEGFQLPDIQALVSLLSFLVGASLGRFENIFGGGRRKLWLVTATFAQCMMAMAAALTQHFSDDIGIAV